MNVNSVFRVWKLREDSGALGKNSTLLRGSRAEDCLEACEELPASMLQAGLAAFEELVGRSASAY